MKWNQSHCINSTRCQLDNEIILLNLYFLERISTAFKMLTQLCTSSYLFPQQASELEGSKKCKAEHGIRDYLVQPLHFTDEERDAWRGEIAHIWGHGTSYFIHSFRKIFMEPLPCTQYWVGTWARNKVQVSRFPAVGSCVATCTAQHSIANSLTRDKFQFIFL